MENAPITNNELAVQSLDPLNPELSREALVRKTRRARARRWMQERIERERGRLFTVMSLAHGMVELSLRRENHPRVRQEVRKQVNQQFGRRRPSWWRF